MNRRDFITDEGATCRNWRWSWAFVNHGRALVISGAWDLHQQGTTYVLLDEAWERHIATGRRRPAFGEARDYLDLVLKHGYRLRIFPMGHMPLDPEEPEGTARIANFTPVLMEATLEKRDARWLAFPKVDGHELRERA